MLDCETAYRARSPSTPDSSLSCICNACASPADKELEEKKHAFLDRNVHGAAATKSNSVVLPTGGTLHIHQRLYASGVRLSRCGAMALGEWTLHKAWESDWAPRVEAIGYGTASCLL